LVMRSVMDEMDIASPTGEGTCVRMVKYRAHP